MNRVIKGLKTYLRDWKNLLTHTIVGLVILAIALFAPVSPYILGFCRGCGGLQHDPDEVHFKLKS